MSANTETTKTRKIQWPTITDHVHIETGLRWDDVQHRGNKVNGKFNSGAFATKLGDKAKWAQSAVHPNGATKRSLAVEITPEGLVAIPEEVQGIFAADNGFLMIKIVSKQPKGCFVQPMRYINGQKGPHYRPLYTYDQTLPNGQRPNGDFVYSIPVHAVVPTHEKGVAGTKQFFFFLVFLEGDDERATLRIDKVTVTKGKQFYRVVFDEHYEERDDKGLIPLRLSLLEGLAASTPELQDLPIGEAVRRYFDNFDR
jgi:hypothetical protein